MSFELVKKADKAVDSLFESTGLPYLTGSFTGLVGQGVDALLDTNIAPTVERVGETLPRTIVESLLTIPEAASGVGVPVAAATWANRIRKLGQILGYGSAALKGTAETESPLGGLISAGSLGLGNKLMLPATHGGLDLGGQAAKKVYDYIGRSTPDIVASEGANILAERPALSTLSSLQRTLPVVARVGTDVGSATLLNEATRQASMSVGPNAVPLDDPARNPLTPENLAGNLVGAGMFAPQAVTGLLNRPHFAPKQVEQLHNWIKTRKEAETSYRGYDWEGPITPEAYHDTFGTLKNAPAFRGRDLVPTEEYWTPENLGLDKDALNVNTPASDFDKLHLSLRTQMDALRQQESEGQTDLAGMTKQSIANILEGMGGIDMEKTQEVAKNLDIQARQMPPEDVKGLGKFVRDLNTLIDQINENTAEWDESMKSDKAKGQTWHPEARSTLVVNRLQDRGLLPKVDEKWLKDNFNAEFDQSGDPQFSYQVTLQKAANLILDNIPNALKREEMEWKTPADVAPTELSSRAQKRYANLDKETENFINALNTLPEGVRDPVIARTAEVFSKQPYISNRGRTAGRLVGNASSWRKAVIRAMQSYNPEDGTALLYNSTTRKFERRPMQYLFLRDENGDYIWNPATSAVPVAEGGKPKISGKPEANLSDVVREGQSPDEVLDEESFKAALAEEGIGGSLGMKESAGLGEGKAGEERNVERVGDVPSFLNNPEAKAKADAVAKNKEVETALGSLNDVQLYRAAQDVFRTKIANAGPGSGQDVLAWYRREGGLRNALQAVRENFVTLGDESIPVGAAGKKFLAEEAKRGIKLVGNTEKKQLRVQLLSFFKAKTDKELLANVGEVVKRITDPEVQKGAKEGPKTRQMSGEWGLQSYWMDPNGNIHDANAKQHEGFAKDIVGLPIDYEGDSYEPGRNTEELQKRGWLRLADSGKERWIDGRFTSQQYAKLEREAIEKGRTLINGRTGKTLYSPPNATGSDLSPVRDAFVNTQPEGRFLPDVQRTLRAKFSQVLGEKGYAGTLRDLYTDMAVAIASQVERVPADFYSIVGKEWGLEKPVEGRGKLGLKLDEVVSSDGENILPHQTKYVNRVLAVLAHEISHIDSDILAGYIDAPDAFSEQRRRHLENIRDLANVLSQDEREAMIQTLRDGFWPEGMQWDVRTGPDKRLYGSQSGEEFVATVNELLTASLLRGEKKGMKDVLEVLDYSPTEVREFARGTYRAIADVLDGLKQTIAHPELRAYVGKAALPQTNPFLTSEAFHAVVNAAREGSELRHADRLLAQTRSTFASLNPGAAGAPPMSSPAMWFRTGQDLQENYLKGSPLHANAMPSETALEGVNIAKDYFAPKDTTKPGLWARWFYPFQQLMFAMERSGAPLARPIAKLALDLRGGIRRTQTQMLNPFLIQSPDGEIHWDQENLLIQKLGQSKTGAWREAVNSVSAWQQEVGAQPMFVRGQDGVLQVNPDPKLKVAEKWEEIRKNLSPEDQQVVQAASVSLDQVGQLAGQRLVATIDASNRHRTASLLMAMEPGMTYDNAMQLADVVVSGFLSGGVSSIDRTGLRPQQIEQLGNFLGGPDGLLAKFKEVSDKLLNRPGFRTESLPGDYIIRFKNENGDIRFLSADSKSKANWLARRLEREGNTIAGEIVHKNELKNYTDLDAPDTILNKFIEVENDTWQRYVRKVEAEQGGIFGQAFVDALKGFTPGATTMKELGVTGMNRFLTERQSRVDRSRYDYIDGTLSWVDRLAASMEYKLTRQQKDLILADPRARNFPSFKGLVEPFFDNLMTPTSQGAKELKAFATAYMMGGSLASAVINGTQSAVTLVPTLIQLGKGIGPVGAYRLLTKSIADATSVSFSAEWQKLAAEAERLDPQRWSKEHAKAYFYKKNLAEGGIQQGIIQDDVFTPTDQRQATLAKFGHGDYGPVTKGELARSGLYLASQLALKPFGWVESWNNRISLFAGIEQGWEKGLRGEALYDHAKLVKSLSTFGGGKANVPGLVPKLSTPYTRSAVGVANTLQQYGYGVVAAYGQLLKDSLGKSEALSVQERRQAQKALATMFATQVAVGGALGLPFAAAALTILENTFGVPANQLVREGLASLGADDDQGSAIAETALNGLGNQMFGLDLSSRVGVTNLAGTSAYRGFNLADLAGPVGSIVGNASQALNWFGQNEPMKAARALVPNSLKTIVDLSDSKTKYGDYGIRDASDRLLYQPTPTQAAAYLLGFRPKEVSEKRQAQKLITFANERASKSRDRELDTAADRLVQGDPSAAQMLAQNAWVNDPTVDRMQVLRSIVQRAVDSQTEKDLLATGGQASEADRARIASTFRPGIVTRQSEIQRAVLSQQLGSMVGLKSNPKEFEKAAMVDALVQGQGMPRSQALRLVEFLR